MHPRCSRAPSTWWFCWPLVLLLHAAPPETPAATVTFTGRGDGRTWASAGNWDTLRVPGAEDDVVVPERFGVIEYVSGVTSVRSLQAPAGLHLLDGTLMVTDGVSELGGTVELEDRATLTASGLKVQLSITGKSIRLEGNLRALRGAAILVGPAAWIGGPTPEWDATGVGSLIDARGVTSLNLGADSWFALDADDGARIDLSGLTSLQGALRPAATRRGVIDLSGARGRWSQLGFRHQQTLRAESGGQILCPGITEFEEGAITLRTEGVISLEQLTNLDGSTLDLSGGSVARLTSLRQLGGQYPRWDATGIGTQIDARNLTNVVLSADGWWLVGADNEARILLSGIPAIRGPLRPTATRGGHIDLSGLRGRWTSSGFRHSQILRAETKGVIQCPGITEILDGQIVLRSEGVIPLAQITNLDGSTLELANGAVARLSSLRRVGGQYPSWSATGIGTLLDASQVTDVNLSADGWWPVTADNEARIDLSGLAGIRGPLRPTATRGGVVDLSGLRGTWTSSGYRYSHNLHAATGGRILCPGITALIGARITLNADGAIPLDQVTQLDDSTLDLSNGAVVHLRSLRRLGGTSPDWSTSGFGTRIDAPGLTEILLSADGWFPVSADGESQVNLSGLTSLQGPIRPTATRGGTVDLSGLRGRWTGAGYRYNPILRAESGGRILCPGLTEFEQGQILLRGDAQLPLDQITSLDGTSLDLGDGAVVRLKSLARLGGINPAWTASGLGTLLEAPGLISLNLSLDGWWPVTADNEARINLPGLSSLSVPMRPTATRGGVIDLSGLRGDWSSVGYRYDSVVVVATRGRILCNGLTGFQRGDIRVQTESRLDLDQVVRLLDAQVTVDGANAILTLGALRNQTGSTLVERNGGRIVFGTLSRIVTQPAGTRVVPGANVALEVLAAGDGPLTYQWFKNGQPLRGQNNATLRLDNVSPEDAGAYTVVVSNGTGSIESEPARVSIQLPALPFADVFAQRGRLTAASGAGTADSLNAGLEPGEPRHAGKRGGRSVWITWRAAGTGVVTLATTGSGFDTLLAVYSGNELTRLTPFAADEDSGGFLTSRVRFNAVANEDYHIAIDGYGGSGGDIVFAWNLELTTLALLPQIVRQPTGAIVVEGAPVSLSVIASPPDVGYQWFLNDVALSGANQPTLNIPSFRPDLSGTYHVRVTTPAGVSLDSTGAVLEGVSRPEARGRPSADKLDDLFTDTELLGAALAGRHHPEPQSPPVAIGLPGSQWTDNTGSSRGPDDPEVCVAYTTASRWFRLQFNVPGSNPTPVILTTEGSAIATLLAVFTNRFEPKLLACDTAALPERPAALVTIPALRGVDYLVLVDGLDGAEGRIRLNWDGEEEVPPLITLQDGRLLVEMRVVPGDYDWVEGASLGSWQPVLRTNVASGIFRYLDPSPASQPARFFRLAPVVPGE